MRLRYTKSDGTQIEFHLGEQPITIGRSPEADIILLDERVSRIHCGVRLWDGEFYIKDLKSRNGTWVNNQRVDVAKLKPGDIIRLGSTTLYFEQEPEIGTQTALREIEGKIAGGQGYTTILREIVSDTAKAAAPAAAPPSASAVPTVPAAASIAPATAEPEVPRVPLVEQPPQEKKEKTSSSSKSKATHLPPAKKKTITIKRRR